MKKSPQYLKNSTAENQDEIEYARRVLLTISCVCPVIDDEFRHNLVKVAVDP